MIHIRSERSSQTSNFFSQFITPSINNGRYEDIYGQLALPCFQPQNPFATFYHSLEG